MKEKKIKNGITYVILGIVGVVMLFPVIWMFFACFKTNNEIFGSLSLLPPGMEHRGIYQRDGRPREPTHMPSIS